MTERDLVQIAFLIAATLATISCGTEKWRKDVSDANQEPGSMDEGKENLDAGGEGDTDSDAGCEGCVDGGSSDTNSDTDADTDTDSDMDGGPDADSGADGGGVVDSGADTSTTNDTSTTVDGDTDLDSGVVNDSDSDTDTLSTCAGGSYDEKSALCWQDPPIDDQMDWATAGTYCDDLDLADHSDWRLPTIDETRLLFKSGGDPACVTVEFEDGWIDPPHTHCRLSIGCPIMKVCYTAEVCKNLDCYADGGCFWPGHFKSGCAQFWTATTMMLDAKTPSDAAFYMSFQTAAISANTKVDPNLGVRCVR